MVLYMAADADHHVMERDAIAIPTSTRPRAVGSSPDGHRAAKRVTGYPEVRVKGPDEVACRPNRAWATFARRL